MDTPCTTASVLHDVVSTPSGRGGGVRCSAGALAALRRCNMLRLLRVDVGRRLRPART